MGTHVSNNIFRNDLEARLSDATFFDSPVHTITLFMSLRISCSELHDELVRRAVVNKEPEKCAGWFWMSFPELARRRRSEGLALFRPLEILLDAHEAQTWKPGEVVC